MADFLLDSLYLRRRGMFFVGRRAGTEQGLSRALKQGGERCRIGRGSVKQEKAFLTGGTPRIFLIGAFKIENSGCSKPSLERRAYSRQAGLVLAHTRRIRQRLRQNGGVKKPL